MIGVNHKRYKEICKDIKKAVRGAKLKHMRIFIVNWTPRRKNIVHECERRGRNVLCG